MDKLIDDYSVRIFDNPHQGFHHRALFVCSGGILRSATAAHWAAEHLQWNTRSCGIYVNVAVVPLSSILYYWSERIYCMEKKHAEFVKVNYGTQKEIITLGIPDDFAYRDPILISHIATALEPYR